MHYDPFDEARSTGGATPNSNPFGDNEEYDPNAAAVGSAAAASASSSAHNGGGSGGDLWVVVGAEVLCRGQPFKVVSVDEASQQASLVSQDM